MTAAQGPVHWLAIRWLIWRLLQGVARPVPPESTLKTADGRRGHDARRRTLSVDDAVCDICRAARARENSLQDIMSGA